MTNPEINTETLVSSISEIQSYLDKHCDNGTKPYLMMHHSLDFEKALNVAVAVLQSAVTDMEHVENHTKFYAPKWVSMLLTRLSSSDESAVLSDVEYNLFKEMVKNLQFSDYKSASTQDLDGYEVQYSTPKEMMETVMALKNYFHLM